MVYAEAVNTPTESQNYPKATISAQASSKSPSTAQPQELRAPQTSVLHATRHSGCQQAETRARLSTQPSLGARGRVFPIHFYSGNKKKKKNGVGQQGMQLLGLDRAPVLPAQQAPGYQVVLWGTGNREKEGKGRFGVSTQLKQLVSGSQHTADFSLCLTYAGSLQSTCPLPGHL